MDFALLIPYFDITYFHIFVCVEHHLHLIFYPFAYETRLLSVYFFGSRFGMHEALRGIILQSVWCVVTVMMKEQPKCIVINMGSAARGRHGVGTIIHLYTVTLYESIYFEYLSTMNSSMSLIIIIPRRYWP